jgi:ribonuclease P protein component
LFSKGKSISVFPLKVLYAFIEGPETSLQAGVAVSSRHFKKAVERNRIKRVMRESYRLQKLPLQSVVHSQQKCLILFFIYLGKELPEFDEINKKMHLILQKLTDNVSKTTDSA